MQISDEASSLLKKEPDLAQHLHDIIGVVAGYGLAGGVEVSLGHEYEYERAPWVVVSVLVPDTLEEAIAWLDQFQEEWWFEVPFEKRERFIVDVRVPPIGASR